MRVNEAYGGDLAAAARTMTPCSGVGRAYEIAIGLEPRDRVTIGKAERG